MADLKVTSNGHILENLPEADRKWLARWLLDTYPELREICGLPPLKKARG